MYEYLYIHNKYAQYTCIYYINKTFILDAINRDSTNYNGIKIGFVIYFDCHLRVDHYNIA